MLSVKDFRHNLNAKILESDDICSATDVLFDHLAAYFSGLNLLIVEVLKSREAKRELVICKERGIQAAKKSSNPLLGPQVNYELLSQLKQQGHLFLGNIQQEQDGLHFLMLPEDSQSFAAVHTTTPRGEMFITQLLSTNRIGGRKGDRTLLEQILAIYAKALDYYMKILQFEKNNEQLKKSFSNILELLISLLEVKDPYTSGHSSNVKQVSMLMAEHLELNQETKNTISTASILHDMGKIGIAENILNKPSSLTDEEFEEIKKHPLKGALLVANIPRLKQVAKIILHHHERYDGQGYPMGLSGNKIPIESRIIAVADTYDAITSERPYRGKMGEKKAIEIITQEKGKQFDPLAVEAFMAVIYKISKKEVSLFKS